MAITPAKGRGNRGALGTVATACVDAVLIGGVEELRRFPIPLTET